MDLPPILVTILNKVPPKVVDAVESRLQKIPAVKHFIDKQYDELMTDMEHGMRPYEGRFPTHREIPEEGRSREEILAEMDAMREEEESRWADGFVSGAVYHGEQEHIDFLTEVYARNSQANPLHSDLWPSSVKYEAEIVQMSAYMLGAATADLDRDPGKGVCGTVSSGGTESIMLAMKTYRDRAREQKGITKPEMVVPTTAHAAFDKASQYFGIKMIKVPVGRDHKADVKAMHRAITKNTIVIVGSAPSFPQGVIDPIEELSEIAVRKKVGLHVDACLGGFVLPWAEKLGYHVPSFDFRLPGVTSMSADTHKYGYALKGTSVVLYRDTDLRRFQFYTITDWPGGLYFSPSFAGSRAGALSAVCWASMVSLGEEGYLENTRRILETAGHIKEGIDAIPELSVMGDPLWVLAFESEEVDIYRVMDEMTKKNWNLNGLHRPASVHLCVTLPHTQQGVAERFLQDLRDSVDFVKANPAEEGGMAPVYGMAASLPLKGIVGGVLKRYIDLLYRV